MQQYCTVLQIWLLRMLNFHRKTTSFFHVPRSYHAHTYNRFHKRDVLKFYQIFLSPQVKRCAIITYKHGIYELPHELPYELRLSILGN